MSADTVQIYDHHSGHTILCVAETLARDYSWLDEHQLSEDEIDFQIVSVNRRPVPFRNNAKALTHDEFVAPRRVQSFMEQLVDYATWVALALASREKVVVHCKNGRSRSPCVVLAFFMIFRGVRQSMGRQWLTPTFREQRPEIARVSPQFPNFTKFSNVLEELQGLLENSETWIHKRVIENIIRHNQMCREEGEEEHEDYVQKEILEEQLTTEFDRLTNMLPARMLPRSDAEDSMIEIPSMIPTSAIFTKKLIKASEGIDFESGSSRVRTRTRTFVAGPASGKLRGDEEAEGSSGSGGSGGSDGLSGLSGLSGSGGSSGSSGSSGSGGSSSGGPATVDSVTIGSILVSNQSSSSNSGAGKKRKRPETQSDGEKNENIEENQDEDDDEDEDGVPMNDVTTETTSKMSDENILKQQKSTHSNDNTTDSTTDSTNDNTDDNTNDNANATDNATDNAKVKPRGKQIRWTEIEIEKFDRGMNMYHREIGTKKWQLIFSLVKTKTALQIKNRQYSRSYKAHKKKLEENALQQLEMSDKEEDHEEDHEEDKNKNKNNDVGDDQSTEKIDKKIEEESSFASNVSAHSSSSSSSSSLVFRCTECNYTTERQSSFTRHMNTHNTQKQEEEEVQTEDSESDSESEQEEDDNDDDGDEEKDITDFKAVQRHGPRKWDDQDFKAFVDVIPETTIPIDMSEKLRKNQLVWAFYKDGDAAYYNSDGFYYAKMSQSCDPNCDDVMLCWPNDDDGWERSSSALSYSRTKVALRRPMPLPLSIQTDTVKDTWLDWDKDNTPSAFGSDTNALRENHAKWFPESVKDTIDSDRLDLLLHTTPMFKVYQDTIATDFVLLGCKKGILEFVVLKLKLKNGVRGKIMSEQIATNEIPIGLRAMMHAYLVLGSNVLINYGIPYQFQIRSPEIWKWVTKNGANIQTMVRLTRMFQMWQLRSDDVFENTAGNFKGEVYSTSVVGFSQWIRDMVVLPNDSSSSSTSNSSVEKIYKTLEIAHNELRRKFAGCKDLMGLASDNEEEEEDEIESIKQEKRRKARKNRKKAKRKAKKEAKKLRKEKKRKNRKNKKKQRLANANANAMEISSSDEDVSLHELRRQREAEGDQDMKAFTELDGVPNEAQNTYRRRRSSSSSSGSSSSLFSPTGITKDLTYWQNRYRNLYSKEPTGPKATNIAWLSERCRRLSGVEHLQNKSSMEQRNLSSNNTTSSLSSSIKSMQYNNNTNNTNNINNINNTIPMRRNSNISSTIHIGGFVKGTDEHTEGALRSWFSVRLPLQIIMQIEVKQYHCMVTFRTSYGVTNACEIQDKHFCGLILTIQPFVPPQRPIVSPPQPSHSMHSYQPPPPPPPPQMTKPVVIMPLLPRNNAGNILIKPGLAPTHRYNPDNCIVVSFSMKCIPGFVSLKHHSEQILETMCKQYLLFLADKYPMTGQNEGYRKGETWFGLLEFVNKDTTKLAKNKLNGLELNNVLYKQDLQSSNQNAKQKDGKQNNSNSNSTSSGGGSSDSDEPPKCRVRTRYPSPQTVLVKDIPEFESYKIAMRSDLSKGGLCLHHGFYHEGLFFVFDGMNNAKKCASKCSLEIRRMRQSGEVCNMKSEILKGWPDLSRLRTYTTRDTNSSFNQNTLTVAHNMITYFMETSRMGQGEKVKSGKVNCAIAISGFYKRYPESRELLKNGTRKASGNKLNQFWSAHSNFFRKETNEIEGQLFIQVTEEGKRWYNNNNLCSRNKSSQRLDQQSGPQYNELQRQRSRDPVVAQVIVFLLGNNLERYANNICDHVAHDTGLSIELRSRSVHHGMKVRHVVDLIRDEGSLFCLIIGSQNRETDTMSYVDCRNPPESKLVRFSVERVIDLIRERMKLPILSSSSSFSSLSSSSLSSSLLSSSTSNGLSNSSKSSKSLSLSGNSRSRSSSISTSNNSNDIQGLVTAELKINEVLVFDGDVVAERCRWDPKSYDATWPRKIRGTVTYQKIPNPKQRSRYQFYATTFHFPKNSMDLNKNTTSLARIPPAPPPPKISPPIVTKMSSTALPKKSTTSTTSTTSTKVVWEKIACQYPCSKDLRYKGECMTKCKDTDWLCLLCMRKFISENKLGHHVLHSKLHEKNTKEAAERTKQNKGEKIFSFAKRPSRSASSAIHSPNKQSLLPPPPPPSKVPMQPMKPSMKPSMKQSMKPSMKPPMKPSISSNSLLPPPPPPPSHHPRLPRQPRAPQSNTSRKRSRSRSPPVLHRSRSRFRSSERSRSQSRDGNDRDRNDRGGNRDNRGNRGNRDNRDFNNYNSNSNNRRNSRSRSSSLDRRNRSRSYSRSRSPPRDYNNQFNGRRSRSRSPRNSNHGRGRGGNNNRQQGKNIKKKKKTNSNRNGGGSGRGGKQGNGRRGGRGGRGRGKSKRGRK